MNSERPTRTPRRFYRVTVRLVRRSDGREDSAGAVRPTGLLDNLVRDAPPKHTA
jgi:hypothetical protein